MNKQMLFWVTYLALTSSSIASELKPPFDEFGRLTQYPGKTEVSCPKQDKNTGVFLIIGQSNAANSAEKKFTTHYPSQVLNYFNGKCYIASSPLLGATWNGGEWITPLADKLIENKDYTTIVILPSAIGGTKIALWKQGAVLNEMMQAVLAKAPYKVTDLIWHQGEADFMENTTSEDYKQSLYSLLSSLRPKGSDSPSFYYAVATKCGQNQKWIINNPISRAQRSIANPKQNIILAADTDALLSDQDRLADHCHFSETGQVKTATAFAEAIHEHKASLPIS